MLAGSSDGRVGLVDVDGGTIELLEGTDASLTAGAFSPDGSRVAVLSEADGIQLFDVATGRAIGVPMSPGRVSLLLNGVRWAEDGTGVWIAHATGVKRLAADPAGWREIACGIVNRELTAEEWRAFVSETEPQVASCS